MSSTSTEPLSESLPDTDASAEPTAAPLDEDALMAYSEHVGAQATAMLNAVLVGLGEDLGLWAAMADSRPITSRSLAERTGLSERLLREWLAAQAANGFISCDPAGEHFWLTREAALVMAVPDSPASLMAPFQGVGPVVELMPALAQAFRSGAGIPWVEHSVAFFDTQHRFSRPLQEQFLVNGWLAAVPGLAGTLTRGARVADVGCGYGLSTILLAQAYPQSQFVGVDFHDHSIARARAAAQAAGVTDQVSFEVAPADELPPGRYDAIVMVDALHDLGDPVGAARHARSRLAPGGVLVTIDPVAADTVAGNLAENPMAGLMYAVSTFLCTPTALAQEGGHALGALAGETAIRQVLLDAGFGTVQRVGQDVPLNMVLVANP